MFLSAILGIEKSYTKSMVYVMLSTAFYLLFGAVIYVTLIGFPLLCNALAQQGNNDNIVKE